MLKGTKNHKWWPRILTMLQQFHVDEPICGNHKSRPEELCLQNQILRWCWLCTSPHATTFSFCKAEERTDLDCLCVLRRRLDTDTSKDAVHLLCSSPGCEWAASRGFCQERVSTAWTLTRINSTKWFFLCTRYLQSLSTINSGMWEYKQPAVSQLYGKITFRKLVAMIMLCHLWPRKMSTLLSVVFYEMLVQ